MNCIIVDDEELSRMTTKKCVEQVKNLNLVAVCEDAISATEALKNNQVDLVFLDIEMPGMTGIELVRNFDVPQIIFITSREDYAIEAFDLDVTDYVTKPLELPRFLKAVAKAEEIHTKKQEGDLGDNKYVFIKQDSRYIKLKLSDILYVEALADYVNIYLEDKRHTILSTMKSIEARLPEKDFVRVHRSFIVRIDRIKEIEDNTVVMGEKLIPVSRSYKENLMTHLKML